MKGGSGVNNQMKKICGFIYRVKRRMGWNKWLHVLFQYLIAAALFCVVFSLIALFVPWYEVICFMAAVIGVGFVGSIVSIIVTYPTNKAAALTADAYGAKESLITAYELKDKSDTFTILQRKQAFEFISAASPKAVIKIRLKWKMPCIFIGICCLAIGILFIPTTAKENAVLLHEAKEALNEMEAVVEKLEEQIKEDTKLTVEEKKIFEQFLQEALLEYEKTYLENSISMEKTLERLDMQLEKLMELNPSLAMNEMAMEIASDLELPLSETMELVMENMSQINGDQATIEDSNATVSSLNNSNDSGEYNGQNALDAGNQGDGQGKGSGDGQGGGSGNGSGNGNGTGNGDGNGGSGTGWDTGSKQGFETDPIVNPQESIYIPDYEIGDDKNLTGDKTDAGNGFRAPSDQVLAWSGQSVDYEQAVGEYSAGVIDQVDRLSIPESMKDMIKSYFDGLNN